MLAYKNLASSQQEKKNVYRRGKKEPDNVKP